MKFYSKLSCIVCAVMIFTAAGVCAATYNPADGGTVYVTEADERINNNDTAADNDGDTAANMNKFSNANKPSERISVMVRKVNESTVSDDIIKATTVEQENTWFDDANDTDGDLGEIVYINEYAPENDTPQTTYATGAFSEGLKVSEALTPGRYVLFLGSSADLQTGTQENTGLTYYGGVSPKHEDDVTPVYTEYFNVYDNGQTQSIGLRWKDAKTGPEMRTLQDNKLGSEWHQNCPATEDEYHIAYIADIYGYDSATTYFGMKFSYTDGENKVLSVYATFEPKTDVAIAGGACARFGLEVCKVPAANINTFKAEGFIEPVTQ